MNQPLKKVALIGPESTGKTTLCRKLALHYETTWAPEFARDYIETLGRKYNLEDVIYCAEEQAREEQSKTNEARQFLFCDTEMITAKVWCEDVFKTVPPRVEEMIMTNRYDLFLLTFPDLPFHEDPVRENPHRREFFFDWYKRELEERKFPYEIIMGVGEDRLQKAIHAIERILIGKKII